MPPTAAECFDAGNGRKGGRTIWREQKHARAKQRAVANGSTGRRILGQTHGVADSEDAAIALAAGDRQRAAEFGEDARGDAEAETCAAAARFRRSCLFERT